MEEGDRGRGRKRARESRVRGTERASEREGEQAKECRGGERGRSAEKGR